MNYKQLIFFFLLIPTMVFGAFTKPSKFIVITPPKCGTYLLNSVIKQISGKNQLHYTDYYLHDLDHLFTILERQLNNNNYVLSHLPADPILIDHLVQNNYKVITILRDPRDQLISAIYWVLSGRDRDHLFDVPVNEFKQLSLSQQIDELMTGERFGFRVFDILYRRHYGWLDLPAKNLLVVRFEDLVGPEGGGNRKDQINAIMDIAKKIGLPMSKTSAANIADNLFGKGPTFRSGQTENWKEMFSADQKQLFDQLYREDLLYLGYPLSSD